MSVRLHVTAVRSDDPESVRRAFLESLGERFESVSLRRGRSWISFQTSVWAVGSPDLIKGLETLELPALQFTTEDACRWYVTLLRPGSAPMTLTHTFGLTEDEADEDDYAPDEDDYAPDETLAFLEDETAGDGKPLTAFERFAEEYRELGIPLPDDLIQEGNALPFQRAIGRYLRWEADCLIDFLRDAAVEFDEDAVRRTLRWEGLSEAERHSDIGNLPRLLSQIGLGKEWDDWVRDAEAYREQDEDGEEEAPPPEPAAWIEPAASLTRDLRVTPISGQPVDLPFNQFHRVGFLPECCQVENDITALLTVELPPGSPEPPAKPSKAPPNGQMRTEYRRTAAGFQIGFENHPLVERRHIAKDLGPEIAALLKAPLSGTRITLAFAAPDEEATRQAYSGATRDDKWLIDAASPPVTRDDLANALELAVNAELTRHTARDEDEADAVMEAVRKDGYLHGMEVQRNGLVISCKYDVDFLAKILLRLRHGDTWDFDPFFEIQAKAHRERLALERKLRRDGAKMARQMMAKRLGKPIFHGRSGPFFRSDLSAFGELQPDQRTPFEAGMQELGFTLLGEITPKRFRDYALLCYISPDGTAYADLTASKFGYLCYEFISEFTDGSRLTTTTSPLVMSRPEVKLYYKDFPGMELEALYQRHRELCQRFLTHKQIEPIPLEATLEGLARRFDDTILRTDEDERNHPDEEDEDFRPQS